MQRKKIASLCLAVCMILSLSTTLSFAAGDSDKTIRSVSFSGVIDPVAGEQYSRVQADQQDGLYLEGNQNTASWSKVLYTGAIPDSEQRRSSGIFQEDSIYCLTVTAQINAAEGYSFIKDFRFRFPALTVAAAEVGPIEIESDFGTRLATATQHIWFYVGDPKSYISFIDEIVARDLPAPTVGAASSGNGLLYGENQIRAGAETYTATLISWSALDSFQRPDGWKFSKQYARDAVGYPVDGYTAKVQFVPVETGYKFDRRAEIVIDGVRCGTVTDSVDQIPSVTGEITWYTILDGEMQNGYLSYDKEFAAPGEKVAIVGHPDSGYMLDSVTVKKVENTVSDTENKIQKIGEEVKATRNSDGTYSIDMPDSAVIVSGSFSINHAHKLVFTPEKKATCKEAGNIAYYTCSICGNLFADKAGRNQIGSKADVVVKKLAHNWTEWTTTRYPSGAAPGERSRRCLVCGEVETEKISGGSVTVTFDPNGGKCSVKASETGEKGLLKNLPTPTRDGYTFDGWYTKAGTKVSDMTSYAIDTTLIAHWKLKEDPYGIEFHEIHMDPATTNGKVSMNPVIALKGEPVTVTVTPNTGYSLSTIYAKGSSGGSITIEKESDNKYVFKMINEDVSVLAVFTADANTPVDTEKPEHTAENCPSRGYSDIGLHAWYHEEVDYVVSHGIMKGMSDYSFIPTGMVDRATLVTTLHRMAGSPKAERAPFKDVSKDSWYVSAVDWAYANGIVMGTSESTFSPSLSLTREQMVTILYRYCKSCGGIDATNWSQVPFNFTDSSKISPYALDAMKWAYQNGLIYGVNDNRILPEGITTRVQLAAILMRYDTTFQDQ